jgi:hypothetical protein
MAPTNSDNTNPMYRYPVIETLLSRATHIVHSPHGQLTGLFLKYYRDVADEMTTPTKEGDKENSTMVRHILVFINPQ